MNARRIAGAQLGLGESDSFQGAVFPAPRFETRDLQRGSESGSCPCLADPIPAIAPRTSVPVVPSWGSNVCGYVMTLGADVSRAPDLVTRQGNQIVTMNKARSDI